MENVLSVLSRYIPSVCAVVVIIVVVASSTVCCYLAAGVLSLSTLNRLRTLGCSHIEFDVGCGQIKRPSNVVPW